ncbi:MAG TPA: TerC family protein [Gemmataceae bacterium]|nr:TerC family protein [Gemmataceae bacterium]
MASSPVTSSPVTTHQGMNLQSWAILAGFHIGLIAILALDLGVFQKRAHVVGMKEAALWTVVWIVLALLFALGIANCWHLWDPGNGPQGPEKAVAFLTGYLVELSLSVDNLFVFLLIFRYFQVPDHLRHRVLFWGIVGAALMRATFILAGAALLIRFHWLIYLFGGFLIFTAYKLVTAEKEEIDPGKNLVLRLARRFLPVVENYESERFVVRVSQRIGDKTVLRRHLTPLALVLLVVESMDVVFAVDSIPAIFGITRDPFIVYTSNIFAIIGLRSLYFLLAGFLGKLQYLDYGLAAVLAFVGLKMIMEEPIPALNWPGLAAILVVDSKYLGLISLGVVVAILAAAVVPSVVFKNAKQTES